MKLKKILALALVSAMAFSMVAYGAESSGVPKYSEIVLGEDYLELEAEVEFFHNRTDRSADGYMKDMIARFNEVYPNITIIESSTTNYIEDYNMRLGSGEWTGIMKEQGGDYSLWPDLFQPIDDLANMEDTIRWAESDSYEGTVYAVNLGGTPGLGIVYNKRVWEEAGITELPKSIEEYMSCLQMIKENTDAIPLYTNYMDNSGMNAPWHALGISSEGDATYMNQKLAKAENPFAQGHGIYDILKVYYDAVANGLTEEDYTATDWETSKAMINSGEAASVIISSWYLAQAKMAGDTPEDVGYMVFPYSIDGQVYTKLSVEQGAVINKNDTDEVKTAALIFIKWMTEESMWPDHEDLIPSCMKLEDNTEYDLNGAEMFVEANALPGEENLLTDMKEESTLLLNWDTVRPIVEAAASGNRTFDEIMDEMNQKWSDAQEALGITPEY